MDTLPTIHYGEVGEKRVRYPMVYSWIPYQPYTTVKWVKKGALPYGV